MRFLLSLIDLGGWMTLKKNEDQVILDEINEAYACLKEDKKAWKEELEERHELEGAIGDGLEGE